ncbi:MAG: acyltransferase family protein [Gammaproteobacteria bacterium]
MHPYHSHELEYRAAVDGLRGVAVLSVLGFHAFPKIVTGGYVGVDVFFVISGFLITGIISRQLRRGSFSFADFYWRRVRRLFPALVLVLTATLLLGWLVLLPNELEQLGKHVAAASLFAANFAYWRESGYFDTAAEFKPLLHLWSLGIEEQFYLLWPAVLVSLWKHPRSLIAVSVSLVVGSFVLSVALSGVAPIANFYSPFTRFWELGAGCLLGLLKERHDLAPSVTSRLQRLQQFRFRSHLPIVGVIMIIASVVLLDSDTPFPGLVAMLPVVGALLVIISPESEWFQTRVLGSRTMVWTGLISYALYLWHWPLLSFANIVHAGAPPPVVRCTALALSVVLAGLTYHFIEVKIRRRKALKVNLGLVAAAGVAGIAGLAVYAAQGVTTRFDNSVLALGTAPSTDPVCMARVNHDKRINYCRTASPREPSILFMGDSTAHTVYEAAVSFLSAEHPAMLLARGGCPAVLDIRFTGYDLNEQDCEPVWRMFVDYARRVKPKVVVIVGSGTTLLTGADVRIVRNGADAEESKETVFEHGVRTLIRELLPFSRVIYLREIPAFDTAPACFLRAVRLPTTRCAPQRSRDQVEQEMAPYNRVVDRLQYEFPDVVFVDVFDALCTDGVCSQQPPGKPLLYSDEVHLSLEGARLLVESTELVPLILHGAHTG